MHKLINRPTDVVREMLEGFARAYEHDVVLTDNLIVARRVPKAPGKVGLVIGNGSGHEPAMIGWIGPGPLNRHRTLPVAGRSGDRPEVLTPLDRFHLCDDPGPSPAKLSEIRLLPRPEPTT